MKRLCAAGTALALLFLSGCGIYANYREISQLQVIETIGFDEEMGKVRLSVSTGASAGGSGGGGGQQGGGGSTGGGPPTRMTAVDKTIHLAATTLQDYSISEELYYAHTRYILLGESAADNAERYLDYVERSVQTRLNAPLLVVRGVTASQMVMETGGGDSDITQALASLERDSTRRGDARFFSCSEIASALAGSGAALCVCLRAGKTEAVSGTDSITPLPDGFVILKNGSMVGHIDAKNGRGVTLMLGELSAGDYMLPGGVTVEFSGCDAKFDPVWREDGSLERLDVKLSLKASLLEMNEPVKFSDDSTLALLGTLLAREAVGWVENVLEKSTDLSADFMGLGHKISLASPGKWCGIEDDWPELIGSLNFQVTAEAEILRSYNMTDPLDVRGNR